MGVSNLLMKGDVSREAPLFPGYTLVTHVTMKGGEAGAFLGAAAAGASVAIKGGNFMEKSASFCGKGALIGGGLGLAMVLAKSAKLDAEGIEDRAIRLRDNGNQVRIDRCALLGAAGVLGVSLLQNGDKGAAALTPALALGRVGQGIAAGLLVGIGLNAGIQSLTAHDA
jgi:hypothetical protein